MYPAHSEAMEDDNAQSRGKYSVSSIGVLTFLINAVLLLLLSVECFHLFSFRQIMCWENAEYYTSFKCSTSWTPIVCAIEMLPYNGLEPITHSLVKFKS